MEDQQRLAAPDVEDVAERDDVTERLRHLRRVQLEHPVVHPDPSKWVVETPRLRKLVLVMREAQVASSTVDLEFVAEELLRHGRALDVPARPAGAPRRFPGRILVGLLRLPEGEVALIALQRALLLGDHLLELRSRQPSVVRKARNLEVDVPVGDVREVLVHEQLDEADDLLDRLRRTRFDVGPSEPKIVRVHEEPRRRALG